MLRRQTRNSESVLDDDNEDDSGSTKEFVRKERKNSNKFREVWFSIGVYKSYLITPEMHREVNIYMTFWGD